MSLYSFVDNFLNGDYNNSILSKVIPLILVLLLTLLFLKLGKIMLNRVLVKNSKNRKMKTIVPVIYQVYRVFIVFIAGCFTLPIFGVSSTPLVAVSSSVGLIVGIGAQQTIRDLISGFFILSENQFSVGDLVSVAGVRGKVLEIGLRTTILKCSNTGERLVVPNSSITIVQNASVGMALAKADIAIPNTSQVSSFMDRISANLQSIFNSQMMEDHPQLVGITKMDHLATTVLIQVSCKPMYKIECETILRTFLRENFDAFISEDN